jgi:hypothetical protein
MTKHNSNCRMVFGRKDPTCPRCQELLRGAPPRQGWQGAYYKRKKREEEQRSRAIREHDCKKSKCMPVCTAFDW